jgi:hypothetical protein
MTKGRDNAAESLGDVVELVRIGRHSGLLSVERIQGGRFEEGEIYFQAGQPTYARAGQMAGQEALIWLLSWHQVYFTFLANEPPPNIPSAVAADNRMAVAVRAGTPPVPPTYPQVPQVSQDEATPKLQPKNVNVAFNAAGTREAISAQQSMASAKSNGPTPGLEWLIPQKVGKERDVMTLPLTRPQRSIYMLVDGRRTVSDLSRCMRKSLQEVERLLSELKERGLITV